MTVVLVADVERYPGIAERWPLRITLQGTPEQIRYFLDNGIYEAGCDDLFVPFEKQEPAE